MKSAAFVAAVLGLSLLSGAVQAHHLWLEVEGQAVRLYFGEFGENLRETSLDKLQPQAKAAAASEERPLAVEKSGNGFAVAGKIDAADSIVAEDPQYPVFVRSKDGVTTRSVYMPAARFIPDRTPRAASLTLDLVPAADGKFKATFKGKPLARTKVEVLTPSGWTRELQTTDDGEFAVDLPWRGTYVLEVHHSDRTPGKRGEEAYDLVNYVTSLTIGQAQGLDPLPALPAAKPH